MCATVRIAPFLDHTLLAPEASASDIDQLCDEAVRHGMAAVCVNAAWVTRCAARVSGSGVVVAAVVAFPFGASTTDTKAYEASQAVADGARELDMVASLWALRAGDWRYAAQDIAKTVRAANGALVKVIIESALLSSPEIVRACEVARDAGAGFVKTSTGYHARGGATTAAVRLMRRTVGDAMGVKASGGIRDCASAAAMFAAGATRIGTSRGAELADCRDAGPRGLGELDPMGDAARDAAPDAVLDRTPDEFMAAGDAGGAAS